MTTGGEISNRNSGGLVGQKILGELSNQEKEELSLIYKLKPVICFTMTAFE